MEITALCISLSMTVLMLLVTRVDFSYSQNAAFPQVFPNRQQHFQYESIVVSCEGLEGLTGWRVMRKINGVIITCASRWATSTGPCKITNGYPALDSGEYWCEVGGRKKSNTVNITVVAGSVILESPVLPVTEGDTVTLRCTEKQRSSNPTADFFKDGHIMESSSTGNMTIHSVSKSNEGFYKCRISGAGESPESWLTVKAYEEPHPSSHHTPLLPLLLCIGVGVPALLLLLVGILLRMKRQLIIGGPETSPPFLQCPSSPQTSSRGTIAAVPIETVYATLNRPTNVKGYTSTLRNTEYHI